VSTPITNKDAAAHGAVRRPRLFTLAAALAAAYWILGMLDTATWVPEALAPEGRVGAADLALGAAQVTLVSIAVAGVAVGLGRSGRARLLVAASLVAVLLLLAVDAASFVLSGADLDYIRATSLDVPHVALVYARPFLVPLGLLMPVGTIGLMQAGVLRSAVPLRVGVLASWAATVGSLAVSAVDIVWLFNNRWAEQVEADGLVAVLWAHHRLPGIALDVVLFAALVALFIPLLISRRRSPP